MSFDYDSWIAEAQHGLEDLRERRESIQVEIRRLTEEAEEIDRQVEKLYSILAGPDHKGEDREPSSSKQKGRRRPGILRSVRSIVAESSPGDTFAESAIATRVSNRIGEGVKMSSLRSALDKMVKDGFLRKDSGRRGEDRKYTVTDVIEVPTFTSKGPEEDQDEVTKTLKKRLVEAGDEGVIPLNIEERKRLEEMVYAKTVEVVPDKVLGDTFRLTKDQSERVRLAYKVSGDNERKHEQHKLAFR